MLQGDETRAKSERLGLGSDAVGLGSDGLMLRKECATLAAVTVVAGGVRGRPEDERLWVADKLGLFAPFSHWEKGWG